MYYKTANNQFDKNNTMDLDAIKKIFVMVFCILIFNFSYAQINSEDLKISAYTEKASLSIKDINTIIHSDKFTPLADYDKSHNKSAWIKIQWNKGTIKNKKFLLNNELSTNISENYFLIKDNRVIDNYSTGIDEPFSTRPVKHFKFVLDISKADYVLANFCCNPKLSTYFQLLNKDELEKDYYNRLIKYAVIFALIAAFILYNFFIGLYLRDKKYFWYCCYLGSALFVLLSTSGVGKEFLWPDVKNLQFMYYNQGIIFSTAGLLFIISFLDNKTISKRTFQLIFIMVSVQTTAAIIFLIVFFGFNDSFLDFLNQYLSVVQNLTRFGLLLNMYILIRSVIAGDKTARLLLIGYSIVNIGVVVLLLRRFYIIPDNSWTQFGMEIAIVIEAIFLSLVLAQNMQRLRQENLRIEKQQQLQLQQFSWKLIEIQEEEKRQIGSTLHDSFTHQLLILKNKLTKKIGEGPEVSGVEKILDEIRTLSHLIHPYILEKLGLKAALLEMTQQLIQNNDFDINLSCCNCQLSQKQELIVFRIIQEALNNIVKHANADECVIALECKQDLATIIIKDDGDGFEVTNNDGFGIRMMKERCDKLSAEVNIKSSNVGTTIKITFPINTPKSIQSTIKKHAQ